MDFLIDLSWRAYPAGLLMAVGFALALRGSRTFKQGFEPPFDGPSRILAGVRGFRRGIFGLAIAGIGAAWLWQIDWVLVLSLVIGGEELLESTFHIQALSLAERNKAGAKRGTARLGSADLATATARSVSPGLTSALTWRASPSRPSGGSIVRRY